MANYDKYDPKAGGFRAYLKDDWEKDDIKEIIGVGLDANGLLVKGGGSSGCKGVLILTEELKAGDVVDVMTDGEIVDIPPAYTPGSNVFALANGDISGTGTGANYVGTVVAGIDGNHRLVVRFETRVLP